MWAGGLRVCPGEGMLCGLGGSELGPDGSIHITIGWVGVLVRGDGREM